MTDPRPRAAGRCRRWLVILLLACLLPVAAGCTRSAVPLTVVPETSGPGGAATPMSPTTTPGGLVINPAGTSYAVVWVPPDQTLALRQPAGPTGASVGNLLADARGIRLSGNSVFLGSSQWVEIAGPGGTGWVNSWHLTEEMSPSEFCADSQVLVLLEGFVRAIENQNGPVLAGLVSPRRGLVIRHDWWNPEVALPTAFIPEAFVSREEWEWGVEEAGQIPIQGRFIDIILPVLDDVFGGDPEVTCNSLRAGTTAETVRWPGEFTNLNFYAYYRPDRQAGAGFNWRTCGIGIEYVEGQPYVAVLVFYRGEI